MSVLDMTLNNLMVRFQWCCSISMVLGLNEQLQQQLEYTLLKSDWHSWWVSKMQSGREDTLEERYAMQFCFKLGKNATETYGVLQTAFGASCMNRASVFEWHERFKEGRESERDNVKCGRCKEVRTPELIGQRVRVRDTRVRASRHIPHPYYSPDLVTFGYSLSSRKTLVAVIMWQLRRLKRQWRRSLIGSHKRTSMGPSRSCWNGTTSELQLEEITSKVTRVSLCTIYKSAHT